MDPLAGAIMLITIVVGVCMYKDQKRKDDYDAYWDRERRERQARLEKKNDETKEVS